MPSEVTSSETALITGASSGIGLQLAKLFAADKSDLVLVARQRDKLDQLADQLRRRHDVRVTVFDQDLTARDGPGELQRSIQDAGIFIDVLVNNAGFGAVGPFGQLPHQQQMNMTELNVLAVTDLTRRFLPGMQQRRRGAILNVASTAAFQPGPNMAVYFATKAYVLSLSEALAEEVRGTGVTVTCLCPGPTETNFGDRSGVNETLLFRLGTMDASVVALKGYRAMRRGKALEVPGAVNRLVTASIRVVPRAIVRKISARLVQSDPGDVSAADS